MTNQNNTNETKNLNEIVGENIKNYIDAVGRSHKWVYERADIPKATFYKLLRGEGDLNRTVPKINQLFRIEDPFYFYQKEFQLPRTIKEIKEQSNIQNFSAASYNGKEDDDDFHETMRMLEDFISMIDVLETVKELG